MKEEKKHDLQKEEKKHDLRFYCLNTAAPVHILMCFPIVFFFLPKGYCAFYISVCVYIYIKYDFVHWLLTSH